MNNLFLDTIDIILVGNGFDLANNYKTSYNDFVTSKFFDELINNDLAKFIKAKQIIQNWVDVEMEIAEYSNNLYDEYKGNIPIEINEKFEKEFDEVCIALNNFIIDAETRTYHTTNPYMEELVEKWLFRLQEENKNAFIVSFNYLKGEYRYFSKTTLHQKLFVHNNPIPIHGTVSAFENRIVLGVDETNLKHSQYNFLLKSLNKNTKTKGYFTYIGKADRIILFGCSLGDTDYRYYSPLFKNVQNKKYEIYCYGEEEYLKIRQRINKYAGDYKDLFYEQNEVLFYDSSMNDYPIICHHP
ncbi:MAG: hypothetical protein IKW51_04030 [Bacteroidales bacterium]|nr:hypothetical protein [Bacteroidales bacterium]